MRARVLACQRDVFEIYNNNTSPRLTMIIIQHIILYFIQITHTDDFPSTGTRLVITKPDECQNTNSIVFEKIGVMCFG